MKKWGQSCALALGLAAVAPSALGAPQVQAQITAALGAGNARQAEQLADGALTADVSRQDRGVLLVDRGMAREAQGHHDDALVDLTEAINLRALPAQDQAHALFVRGAVLDALGRVADAIADYGAALSLKPRYAPALNNRANAYRRQNQFALAERDYVASLSAGNMEPEYSYYGLGQIAEARGNVQGARGFYAQAVAANPDYGLAAERLAALGGAAPGADNGIIHLHPPGSAHPADTAPIVLKPPGTIHLHPPQMMAVSDRQSPPPRKAEPVLRPALDDVAKDADGKAVPHGEAQLGAWRSEAEAEQGWTMALKRSNGFLDGRAHRIVAVDLPGKGRYYRLWVSAGADAPSRFCDWVVAQGVVCIPARD